MGILWGSGIELANLGANITYNYFRVNTTHEICTGRTFAAAMPVFLGSKGFFS